MFFHDRTEAGQTLAQKLLAYADRQDVLVLALPRGGVPVAFEVARALHAPLDVFIVRKLGVPGHEELAMGAIATGGVRVLNESVVQSLQIPTNLIDAAGNYTNSPIFTSPYANGLSDKVADDPRPYSETIFEPSPLNRVTEQGAPGAAWQPGTGKTIKKDYLINLTTEVFKFSYDPATGLASLPTDPTARYYASGQLYANKATDEQGHAVIEYVDKKGRTICKKVQVSLGLADRVNQAHWAHTYYIYDDLGNLVVVIPPEGVKAITGN